MMDVALIMRDGLLYLAGIMLGIFGALCMFSVFLPTWDDKPHWTQWIGGILWFLLIIFVIGFLFR